MARSTVTDADLLVAAEVARAGTDGSDPAFAGRLRFARGMGLLTSEAQVIDLSAPGALADAPNTRAILSRARELGIIGHRPE